MKNTISKLLLIITILMIPAACRTHRDISTASIALTDSTSMAGSLILSRFIGSIDITDSLLIAFDSLTITTPDSTTITARRASLRRATTSNTTLSANTISSDSTVTTSTTRLASSRKTTVETEASNPISPITHTAIALAATILIALIIHKNRQQ